MMERLVSDDGRVIVSKASTITIGLVLVLLTGAVWLTTQLVSIPEQTHVEVAAVKADIIKLLGVSQEKHNAQHKELVSLILSIQKENVELSHRIDKLENTMQAAMTDRFYRRDAATLWATLQRFNPELPSLSDALGE